MPKKFGRVENSLYLCTRNSEMRRQGGSVAQLNRASDYGSEGCGFESRRNHKENQQWFSFFCFSDFGCPVIFNTEDAMNQQLAHVDLIMKQS